MKKINIITIIIPLIFLITSCAEVYVNDKVIHFNGGSEPKEVQYVSGTEDVPLLPGLSPINDDVTNFDTMNGNIVISTYGGSLSLQEAKEFYLKTLPQLGWQVTSSTLEKIAYERSSDSLEIFFAKEKNQLVVKFFVSSSI